MDGIDCMCVGVLCNNWTGRLKWFVKSRLEQRRWVVEQIDRRRVEPLWSISRVHRESVQKIKKKKEWVGKEWMNERCNRFKRRRRRNGGLLCSRMKMKRSVMMVVQFSSRILIRPVISAMQSNGERGLQRGAHGIKNVSLFIRIFLWNKYVQNIFRQTHAPTRSSRGQ